MGSNPVQTLLCSRLWHRTVICREKQRTKESSLEEHSKRILKNVLLAAEKLSQLKLSAEKWLIAEITRFL